MPVSDPVLIFFIAMVVILTAPLIMNRFRAPALVGLILAGTLVGPSMLGLLERDQTIILLGTVGLLYLMFVAGLSIDLAQFARLRRWSLGFGVLSFLIPQVAALAIGTSVLGFTLAQSLRLGSIVGSHTLLAYPIADRLGITENRGVTIAIGATLITDLLSLTILAVVVASIAGDTSAADWGMFAGFVAAWAAMAVWLIPRLGTWFFRHVRHGPTVDFSFLMAVLFFSAWTASLVGLAPIIGAFVAGLAMNRLVPPQSPLMTRIKFVGDALLIPFFLISVGMLIDVGVLFSSTLLWGWALTFSALVIVGKSLAAKLAQFALRNSSAEGWTVAGLTIPQAAATLAVTLVGFEIGLFSEMVVKAVVVMILITSVVGPWLVERFGRVVALAERERGYEPSDAPQRILVPLANPETAPALMDLAISIRALEHDQPLYPLTVAREGPDEAAAVAASERLLGHAVVHAAAADVPVVPITRVDHNVARGIDRAVRERRITTVLFGWEGGGRATSLIFGTVLDQFLDQSTSMVLVSRMVHPLASVERVLLVIPPYGEREPGFIDTIATLKRLTARTGAVLHLVTVETATGAGRLAGWIERTEPETPMQVHHLPAWEGLFDYLDGLVSPGDLIALLSSRRGTVSWRPELLRLPRQLTSRYPEADLITAYSPQERRADVLPPDLSRHDLPALVDENVTLNLQPGDLSSILTQVLTGGLKAERDTISTLATRIASQQGDYAPELAPGVTLYHLHTSVVRHSQLFMGVSDQGIDLPETSGLTHVVLVILAPIELDPNAYLNQLAVTASLIHRVDLVEDLLQATDPADARARLLRGIPIELSVASQGDA